MVSLKKINRHTFKKLSELPVKTVDFLFNGIISYSDPPGKETAPLLRHPVCFFRV